MFAGACSCRAARLLSTTNRAWGVGAPGRLVLEVAVARKDDVLLMPDYGPWSDA